MIRRARASTCPFDVLPCVAFEQLTITIQGLAAARKQPPPMTTCTQIVCYYQIDGPDQYTTLLLCMFMPIRKRPNLLQVLLGSTYDARSPVAHRDHPTSKATCLWPMECCPSQSSILLLSPTVFRPLDQSMMILEVGCY